MQDNDPKHTSKNVRELCRLMQDNDPKHTHKKVREFMEERSGVIPPKSPHCNPIENHWHKIHEKRGEASDERRVCRWDTAILENSDT